MSWRYCIQKLQQIGSSCIFECTPASAGGHLSSHKSTLQGNNDDSAKVFMALWSLSEKCTLLSHGWPCSEPAFKLTTCGSVDPASEAADVCLPRAVGSS